MSRYIIDRQRIIAISASSILAAGWYFSTSAILAGASFQIVPILGTIAIAAFMPDLIRRRLPQLDRARAQGAITQQLELLKMHTMVNVVDTNGKLVEVNDVLLEATGHAREDLIGKPVATLYGPMSKDLVTGIRDLLASGKGWEGETSLLKRDGNVCIAQTSVTPLKDDNGNWIGSITARTDITKATQLISERDTALTLHELRDDVWIIDQATMTFKYMNRVAKRRFGWNSKSYNGLTLEKMAEDRNCQQILEICQDLHAANQSFTSREIMVFGRTFELSVKLLHIRTKDSRFLIMLHDISDRIAQQRQQADFISMVSHELRSPLTSIKGSMGLLLSKAAGELPHRAEALLEIAHRNADRLVLIINDILDIEKITSGRIDFDIDQCDMSELVQEALRANASAYQRYGLTVRCTGIDTPVILQTDANRIIQVLTNLLSNAAKFSTPRSAIDIDVACVSNRIRVSVRDYGAGIPQRDQHKIFQRFADMSNSDRSSKGGTGLGLSICKAIIDSLGGTIEFQTVEGRGTTFTFTLPEKNAKVIQLDEKPALRNVG